MVARYAALLASIVIDDANNDLRFDENAVSYTAIIAPGTYFLRGDGAAGDLCAAIKTAMDATASANTYTVGLAFSKDPSTRGATVAITRLTGANTFRPRFDAGDNSFEYAKIGYTNAALSVGTTFSGTVTPTSIWCSSDFISRVRDRDERDVTTQRRRSGSIRGTKRGGTYRVRTVGFQYIDARRCKSTDFSQSITDPNACLDVFLDHVSDGRRFEFHAADTTTITSSTLSPLTSSTLVDVYHLRQEIAEAFEPERREDVALYAFDLPMARYVA